MIVEICLTELVDRVFDFCKAPNWNQEKLEREMQKRYPTGMQYYKGCLSRDTGIPKEVWDRLEIQDAPK